MSDATTATASTDTTLLGGEGATTSSAETTAATTEAGGKTTEGQSTTTTEGKDTTADGKPADGAKAEGKEGDGKKPEDDKPTGAPEKYEDFKLPEGMKADTPVMGEFATLAKELNLPQEAAQKLVDLAGKMQAGNVEQIQAHIEAQGEAWGNEARADKEFGGDKFDENLAVAKRALDQFGTPELKSLLVASKMGNHPEVLRFFYRAGQAISQDGFVPGKNGAATAPAAQRIFSASNMNP
jgi:hypothetical protein